MQNFFADPVTCWLAVGAFLIAVEAFTMPGLGLFLIGIGALGAAVCTQAGWIDVHNLSAQLACCFGIAAMATVVLWKPLKKFRLRGKHKHTVELNSMVGQTATVAGGGLVPGKTGQVSWSGTLMNAELSHESTQVALAQGAPVVIRSVSGTTLRVAPK